MPSECEKALVELGYWLCELHDSIRWRKKTMPRAAESVTSALKEVEKKCRLDVGAIESNLVEAARALRAGDRKAAGRAIKYARENYRRLVGD